MAPSALGKRKSRTGESGDDAGVVAITPEDAQDVFRRHFEAQFKPLQTGDPRTGPGSKARTTTAASASVESDEHEHEHALAQGGGNRYEAGGTDLDSEGSGSEWGGLSDAGDDGTTNGRGQRNHGRTAAMVSLDDPVGSQVEVVDHSADPLAAGGAASSSLRSSTMSKKELKAYMSSRPPSLTAADRDRPSQDQRKRAKASAAAGGAGSDPADSADLLANDLALQRLLSESHLLAEAAARSEERSSPASHGLAGATSSSAGSASTAASASFAAGRLRRRTTDLRLQALGSRESIFTQKKMPLAQRRGIALAAAETEKRRRREARECGIVLEAPSSSSSSAHKRAIGGRGGSSKSGPGNGIRRRGDVGAPAVGKLRGAELKLSARDIRSIEGKRHGTEGGKRKKRR